MLKTLEGIYRNGKIEFVEQPGNIANETRVLVTILQRPIVDLTTHSIDQSQAADLRGRFSTFAVDWEQPEMDVYNDYDAAKQNL